MTDFDQFEDLTVTPTQVGTIIPERIIQEVLRLGLSRIHDDPSLIDTLFSTLDDTARNDIRAFYATHNVPVRVNYPRDAITFPLVAIVSAGDNENQSYDVIGDFFTSEVDAARVEQINVIGYATRGDLNIMCLAGKDSNAPMWLYYVVKAILLLNRDTLVAHGLHNLTVAGRDVTFRDDLLPEFTYARSVTLSFDTHFSVTVSERVAKALTLSLFVEDIDSGAKLQVNA